MFPPSISRQSTSMSLISRVETDPGESKLRMVVRCGCGGGGGSGAGKVEAWVSAKSNCPVWVLEIEISFRNQGTFGKINWGGGKSRKCFWDLSSGSCSGGG